MFAFGATSQHVTAVSLSGDVLKYAQLGGSVTLDPPSVTGEGHQYYTWYFGSSEIASYNSFGGSSTKGKHFVSYAASSHKQLDIVK